MLSSWPRHSWPRRYLSCSRSFFTSQSSFYRPRPQSTDRKSRHNQYDFSHFRFSSPFRRYLFETIAEENSETRLFYKTDRSVLIEVNGRSLTTPDLLILSQTMEFIHSLRTLARYNCQRVNWVNAAWKCARFISGRSTDQEQDGM